MKKLVLATAVLTASLGAYAALPTSAAPFTLEIPNLKAGLEITLEGLLLQPSNANLDYVGVDSAVLTGPFGGGTGPVTLATAQQVNSVDPGYDWGFRVGLGYVFANSGNDIQLNWTHFDNSYDSTTFGNPGTLITAAGIPLIPLDFTLGGVSVATNGISATSNLDVKMDAVDLDVGQYVNVGTRLQMRFFGGLRAARVEQNITNNYASSYDVTVVSGGTAPTTVFDGTASYNETDVSNSKFTGIGPRFGVDSSYHVWDCFGIVAHVAASLLIGEVDTDTTGTSVINVNPNPLTSVFPITTSSATNVDDQNRIVPVLDAKLGIDYTWEFQNRSSLSIEAGWQATQYIDAVDSYQNNVGNAFGLGNNNQTTSSIGFQGPYLSLNFNV
jgi:hypothetical protein